MEGNGPADSISHSFRGILEARDTGFVSARGRERTYTASLVRRVEERGKDRGHTSSVSGKNARGTVCPASHFRSAMSSFDFRREKHATALFLWQRPRATSAMISSAMISQSAPRCREGQITSQCDGDDASILVTVVKRRRKVGYRKFRNKITEKMVCRATTISRVMI